MPMRPLIRPGLFAFARLGLFLSVAAWLVTQYWWLRVGSPWLIGDVLPGGYVAGFGYPADDWGIEARPVSRKAELSWVFRDPITGPYMNLPRLDTAFHRFGVTFADYGQLGHLSVRHWLVVTVFALFYALLKWFYRKPRAADE